MTGPRAVYRGFVSDSTRWDHLTLRPGDIVISTPAKSGTTWMQRLVGLLVFDGPDLPRSMAEVSPWLDMNTRPIEQVVADLDAQAHRRFIKTHTPLDGLPMVDEVTYVCVGRDPRDVAVSMAHHLDNMDVGRLISERVAAVGADDVDLTKPPPDLSLRDLPGRIREWMDAEAGAGDGMESLAGVLHHLDTFFAHRHRPNVALFHYLDLKADLPAELLRLADLLGFALTPERAGALAEEASIERMRARASELAPNANQSLWKDTQRFFRSGSGGEWQELMSDADQDHYLERVRALTTPEVAAWAHRGRRG